MTASIGGRNVSAADVVSPACSEQVESMNTTVTTNRHKDTMKWRALALEYEMKISYLERALAQEESKLRIAEQVANRFGVLSAVGHVALSFLG